MPLNEQQLARLFGVDLGVDNFDIGEDADHYWRLDEDSSNPRVPLIGTESVSPIPPIPNQTLTFGAYNITGPQLSAADSTQLRASNISYIGEQSPFTVTCVVVPQTVLANSGIVGQWGNPNDPEARTRKWQIYLNATTGFFEFRLADDGGDWIAVSDSNTVALDTLYFIRAGFDGSNAWIQVNMGTMKKAVFGGTLSIQNTDLVIGDVDQWDEKFTGMVAKVGLFAGYQEEDVGLYLYNNGEPLDPPLTLTTAATGFMDLFSLSCLPGIPTQTKAYGYFPSYVGEVHAGRKSEILGDGKFPLYVFSAAAVKTLAPPKQTRATGFLGQFVASVSPSSTNPATARGIMPQYVFYATPVLGLKYTENVSSTNVWRL